MITCHTSSIVHRNRIDGVSPSAPTGAADAQGGATHHPRRQSIVATLLICVTVASCLASTGCTTVRVIPPTGIGAAPSLSRIKRGDEVTVLTRDGQLSTFHVLIVENEALVADDHTRYERRDLVRLERRQVDVPKTAGLIAGVTAATILRLLAAAVGRVVGL